jgi:hypothetical protein
MTWLRWFRRSRLVPIAEFASAAMADEAWGRLEGAGIPASVETDPAMLGGAMVIRVVVEAPYVDEAQRMIADLVAGDRAME